MNFSFRNWLTSVRGLLGLGPRTPRRPIRTKRRLGVETLEDRLTPAGAGFESLSIPLLFEANIGQANDKVDYLARGQGYGLFVNETGATLALSGAETETILRLELQGANANAAIRGADVTGSYSNYLHGNDPSQWLTEIPHYAKVQVQSVYAGIDAVYYGTSQRQLEYDFVVAAGADPGQIALKFGGAESISLASNGDLVLRTATGDLTQKAPVLYQTIDGARRDVSGGYDMRADGTVGFTVGAFDATETLVIDPILTYFSYLGESGTDAVDRITLDPAGNVYVAGTTTSADLPTTPLTGPLAQRVFGGGQDVFIAKYEAARPSRITYITYLGGSFEESVSGLAANALGQAIVAGTTDSFDFPTTSSALQRNLALPSVPNNPLEPDAFVATLNATGTGFVYSTYLGGGGSDGASSLALDEQGNVYVAGGATGDANILDAADETLNVSGKWEGDGTSGDDRVRLILTVAVDRIIAADVTVFHLSDHAPTGSVVFDFATAPRIASGAFSFNIPRRSGPEFVSARVTGTINNPASLSANIDYEADDGDPFTPVRSGTVDASLSRSILGTAQFLAKLNPSGGLVKASFLEAVFVTDIAVRNGTIAVAGLSFNSSRFVPLINPTQGLLNGDDEFGLDGFLGVLPATLAQVNYGDSFTFSTFVGGSGNETLSSVALGVDGSIIVGGRTDSNDLPVLHPVQATRRGDDDGFVARYTGAGALAFATYLGGTKFDQVLDVGIDVRGDVYAVGQTFSRKEDNFPLQHPFHEKDTSDDSEAFMTKIAKEGDALIYSSHLGGGGTDIGRALFVRDPFITFVAGQTKTSGLASSIAPDRKITNAAGQPTLDGFLGIVRDIVVVNDFGDAGDADPNDGVADSDLGRPGRQTTLRAAFEHVSSSPNPLGNELIHFGLPGFDDPNQPGTAILNLGSDVTLSANLVTIDGFTQPNAGVEIRGAGLVISGTSNTVRGLHIVGASGDGLTLDDATRTRVEKNQIESSGGHGLVIRGGSSQSIVEENIIIQNTGGGVRIDGANDNRLTQNNVDRNTGNGIEIVGGSESNLVAFAIGTVNGNQGNGILIDDAPFNTITSIEIRGNTGAGVRIKGENAGFNEVSFNDIGAADATSNDGNEDGVVVENASGTRIDRNSIAGNRGHGVRIQGELAVDNFIVGNFIGHTRDRIVIGNGGAGVSIGDGASFNTVGFIEPNFAQDRDGLDDDGLDDDGFDDDGFDDNSGIPDADGLDNDGLDDDGRDDNGLDDDGTDDFLGGADEDGLDNDGFDDDGLDDDGRDDDGIEDGSRTPDEDGLDNDGRDDDKRDDDGEDDDYIDDVTGQQLSRIFFSNTIVGNSGAGIEIEGPNNTVQGNLIGVMGPFFFGEGAYPPLEPFTAVPNQSDGIQILNTEGARIEQNVIAANKLNGVAILNSTNIDVHRNFIGVDPLGTSELGNGGEGVLVVNSNDVRIGEAPPASSDPRLSDFNVIANNAGSGVVVRGVGSVATVIANNLIGYRPTDGTSVGNRGHGVWVTDGASNTLVGGEFGVDGNTIGGSGGDGIRVDGGASATVIRGNLIGSDPKNPEDHAFYLRNPNQGDGIHITAATGTVVGGETAALSGASLGGPIFRLTHSNVIVANKGDGIEVAGTALDGTRIQGNFIGLSQRHGATANEGHGVFLNGTTAVLVGGADALTANWISENTRSGVRISGPTATGNAVSANFLGVSILGAGFGFSVSSNGSGGVFLDNAPDNLIGGSGSAGNLFGDRLLIRGEQAADNRVQGNLFGFLPGGQRLFGSIDGAIIDIFNAPNNRIGGVTSLEGNDLGNGRNEGIHVHGEQATGNVIVGNVIGTTRNSLTEPDSSVTSKLRAGVRFSEGASNNQLGGTAEGEGNTIAFASENGVEVIAGQGNAILGNRIYAHELTSIDLGTDGFTANDAGDSDDGPNRLQNFPKILETVRADGMTTIRGELNSTPNSAFRVELFANPDFRAQGGEKFLTAIDVTTDGNGRAEFTVFEDGSRPVISATATDAAGNTSEFFSVPIVVNKTDDRADADPDDGVADVDLATDGEQTTLRAAIEESNRRFGFDRITFDIPVTGSEVPVISPTEALPGIQSNVHIDASTQPGGGRVILDGLASSVTTGLSIQSPPAGQGRTVTLTHLTVRDFGQNGIFSATADLTLAGVEVQNNGLRGLFGIGTTVVVSEFGRFDGNGFLLDDLTDSTQGHGIRLQDGARLTTDDSEDGFQFLQVNGNRRHGLSVTAADTATTLSNLIANDNRASGVEISGRLELDGISEASRNRVHGILVNGSSSGKRELILNGGTLTTNDNGFFGINVLQGNIQLNEDFGPVRIVANSNGSGVDEEELEVGGGVFTRLGISNSGGQTGAEGSVTVQGNRGDGILSRGEVGLDNVTARFNTGNGIEASLSPDDPANVLLSGISDISDNGGSGIFMRDPEGRVEVRDTLTASRNRGAGLRSAGEILFVGVGEGEYRVTFNSNTREGVRGTKVTAEGPGTFTATDNVGDGVLADEDIVLDNVRILRNQGFGLSAGGDLFVEGGVVCGNLAGDLDADGRIEAIDVIGCPLLDTDDDGVPSGVEQEVNPAGDGNEDGVPDSLQPHVVSLPLVGGIFITISGPPTMQFRAVVQADTPPPGVPAGFETPLGFLSFQIVGLTPGAGVTLDLRLPAALPFNSILKFGPTPDAPTPHYYEFLFDGTTGAEFLGNGRVRLHFVDGARGDSDITADGIILDPIAPAILVNQSPVVDAGSAATVSEGQSLSETGLVADTTSTVFLATVDYGDGTDIQPLTIEADGSFALSHIYADNGQFELTVTVTDDGGLTGTAGKSITVTNVAPTLTISGAASVAEGAAYTLGLSSSDPGSDTIASWTINWGDGNTETFSGNAASVAHVYVDDGTFTISAAATDEDGTFDSNTLNLDVTNVAPSGTMSGAPATTEEGTPVSLTSSVTDAGSLDVHTFGWSVTKNGSAFTSGSGAGFSFTPDDDGSYVVTVTATDDDGASSSDSKTIAVGNAAPTVSVNDVPTTSIEGTPITLGSTLSDPGTADTHTLAWTVTKNGAAFANGSGAGFSFTPDDDGSYVVALTAIDDDGGTGSDTKTIAVGNAAPTVNINSAPASSTEATPITLTATVSDPGTADTHTLAWTVTKNGNAFANGGGASFGFTPDDDGSYVVTVTATDDDGASGSDSKTISVTNVAPTIDTISGSQTVSEGQAVTVSGTFSDPAHGVATETFTGTAVWSDSVVTTVTILGSSFSTTRTFGNVSAPSQTFTVNIRIADDDAGSDTAASGVITVNDTTPPDTGAGTVTLRDGVLTIRGTDANDRVKVRLVGSGRGSDGGSDCDSDGGSDGGCDGSRIKVKASFLQGRPVTFDACAVTKIVIDVAGGNDRVWVGRNIEIGCMIDGGAGNDVLRGGGGHDIIRGGAGNDIIKGRGGNDILLGGEGDDVLVGGDGRDLLIGGLGSDRLVGSDGDDILISGTTDHDTNDLALGSIMAEWASGHSYGSRIGNLMNGSGNRLNGNFFLNENTVHDDGDRDVLSGDEGRDWFLLNLDGSGTKDKVTDARGNETRTDIDVA